MKFVLSKHHISALSNISINFASAWFGLIFVSPTYLNNLNGVTVMTLLSNLIFGILFLNFYTRLQIILASYD